MGHKVHLRALFVWKFEQGSWVRTVVNNTDISRVWARFPPHLRRYNHDHKEWDICPFLETADHSEPAGDPPPAGSAPNGRVSCAEDLANAYDTTQTALSTRFPTSGLKGLLEGRYGMKVLPQNYVPGELSNGSMVLSGEQRVQGRYRLHGRTTDDFGNDQAVCDVWNSIIESHLNDGLPHHFDISPRALFPLSLTGKRLALAIVRAPGEGNNKICLLGIHGKRFSEQWYLLAFKDFATVVQIFREGWDEGISPHVFMLYNPLASAHLRYIKIALSR